MSLATRGQRTNVGRAWYHVHREQSALPPTTTSHTRTPRFLPPTQKVPPIRQRVRDSRCTASALSAIKRTAKQTYSKGGGGMRQRSRGHEKRGLYDVHALRRESADRAMFKRERGRLSWQSANPNKTANGKSFHDDAHDI